MTGTSNVDTTMAELSNNKPRDFSFVLRPPSILNKAVEALSDPSFNPKQKGMIQVGECGFEITVSVTDPHTKKVIIGYFRLRAFELEEFQCNKPLQKMVSLRSLNVLFKDSAKFNHDSVSIFSEFQSNYLNFHWTNNRNGFGHGYPFYIRLRNVKPKYTKFPQVINYGFEAVIPSKNLTDILTRVLQMRPKSRPTNARATFNAPTVHMKLNDNIILSTENNSEKHRVWLDWQYWDSLQKASCFADECSIYVVTNPPHNVMLLFSLGEVADLVYLIQAKFLSDNTRDLPFLGLFRPLKVRRTFIR